MSTATLNISLHIRDDEDAERMVSALLQCECFLRAAYGTMSPELRLADAIRTARRRLQEDAHLVTTVMPPQAERKGGRRK